MASISAYVVLLYLNTTAWMLYYQYHWNYYTLQLKWTQIINPNVVEEENRNNWFIKNKSRYGNLLFIYKLFAFIHILDFIICCICVSILIDAPSQIIRIIGV